MKFSKEKKIIIITNILKTIFKFESKNQLKVQLQTVTRPCLDNFLQISFQAPINICRTSDSAIIWLFQFLVKLWTDPKHMTFGLLDSPSHTTTHTARGVQQVEHSLSPSSLFTYWELYAHQGHILLFIRKENCIPLHGHLQTWQLNFIHKYK